MELKLDPKNPRVALDEMGNKLLTFEGDHLEDWREIIAKINAYEAPNIAETELPNYQKRKVQI